MWAGDAGILPDLSAGSLRTKAPEGKKGSLFSFLIYLIDDSMQRKIWYANIFSHLTGIDSYMIGLYDIIDTGLLVGSR